MSHYLVSFGPAVANHLWQSTAFAAAAWLLTILLRKNSASVRYGIWLAASIKFLIPFSLLIAMGGLLPKPKQVLAPAMYTAMKVTEQPFADVLLAPITPATQTMTLTQRIAADLPAALLALWLAGATAVLIVWWMRWRRASVCLRRAVPATSGRELEILRGLEAGLSGRVRSPLRLRLSTDQTEPSIYGIFRPVLVWPAHLSERLSNEHIEAIMAHELAHARRFDNATAALHMLVEAVFWFHPMVWWMERRMIEERERACDESVVGLGGRPDAYAEGILETCRFCVGPALPCVAGVTGADLRKRVADIMTVRVLLRMSWRQKMLVGAAALCALAAPVLLGQVDTSSDWEKAAGGHMAFDVASIKLNPWDPSSTGYMPHRNFPLSSDDAYANTGGLLSAQNFPVGVYITFAYRLQPDESTHLSENLAKWFRTDHFDIEARGPANATKDQMRLMMQSLLAERFKLAVHWEDKQVPVFSLVLAKAGKTGPQLQPSSDAPCTTAPIQGTAQTPSNLPCAKAGMLYLPNGEYKVMGHHETMEQVATDLRFEPGTGLDRPLMDGTSLPGTFDFMLVWAPDMSRGQQPAQEVSGPSYIEALNDQLGLKLVSTTGRSHYLVIDHIEEPTPN